MPPKKKHIVREILPWRGTEEISFCGRPLSNFDHVVLAQLPRILGTNRPTEEDVKRAGVCRICWDSMWRFGSWQNSPKGVVRQAADAVGSWQLEAELRALEALVKLHQEDFNALLAGTPPPQRLRIEAEFERCRRELEARQLPFSGPPQE